MKFSALLCGLGEKMAWKKIVVLWFACSMFLCGCSMSDDNTHKETGSVGADNNVMEGMEHLYAENVDGYYFDIYSDISKEKERNGIINIGGIEDTLYLKVENAGKKREIAIQIFIDYVQTPIRINGNEYDTYYINADEKYSEEIPFKIGGDINGNENHKIMAAMTVSSDLNTVNIEAARAFDGYSIAYDEILVVGEGMELHADKKKEYMEEPRKRYKDVWEGVLVNNDITSFKRAFPPKEIVCKAGEDIELQYHAGGFAECNEILMVLALDMKQILVNQKNYIHIKAENGEIANGTVVIEAPQKPGLYDLTGWVVKDPFSEKNMPLFPLRAVPRFTIRVE